MESRKSRSEQTKRALLEAAVRLLDRRAAGDISVRDIAAEAGVNHGLVHHYFGTKQRLFVAAMEFPVDVVTVVPRLLADGEDGVGERFVRFVVEQWDRPDVHPTLLGVVRSAATDPVAAGMLRSLLTEGPLRALAGAIHEGDADARVALAGSQLVGLAMARYVVRLEPLASMTPEEVAMGACDPAEVLDPEMPDGAWEIDQGKPNGANPGFRIRVKGVKYMLKADPPDQPDRATGATAIASRLFFAGGWWAPCDSVVYFRPSILRLEPGLTATDNSGVTRPFDPDPTDRIYPPGVWGGKGDDAYYSDIPSAYLHARLGQFEVGARAAVAAGRPVSTTAPARPRRATRSPPTSPRRARRVHPARRGRPAASPPPGDSAPAHRARSAPGASRPRGRAHPT